VCSGHREDWPREGDLGSGDLTRRFRRTRRVWWRSREGGGDLVLAELVARDLSGGGKIWSWSGSSFWCTKKIENMSERCARLREEFQNKEKRRRWSEFTRNFAGLRWHLRIGELECGQPGVGSRDRCVGGRGLYRCEEEKKLEQNQTDLLRVITLSPGKNLGQRLKEMSVLTSGSHMSARKREWERTASGEGEMGRGPVLVPDRIVSRGPFSFFPFPFLFSFSFLFFFCEFCKRIPN
jgi:hypothetical protein